MRMLVVYNLAGLKFINFAVTTINGKITIYAGAKYNQVRNAHEITSATKPDRFWKPVRFDSTYREIISCTFLI